MVLGVVDKFRSFVRRIKNLGSNQQNPCGERCFDFPETDIRHGLYRIDSISDIEVRVAELFEADESLTVTVPAGDARKYFLRVEHIDPASEMGQKIRSVSEGDYMRIGLSRYVKEQGYIPFWCIEDVHEVRSPRGSERNTFG